MRNEEMEMSSNIQLVEKPNCTDCLYCKVSVKSTEKCRLCFCSEIGRVAVLNEFYWLNRTVCYKFESMSA